MKVRLIESILFFFSIIGSALHVDLKCFYMTDSQQHRPDCFTALPSSFVLARLESEDIARRLGDSVKMKVKYVYSTLLLYIKSFHYKQNLFGENLLAIFLYFGVRPILINSLLKIVDCN